MRRHHSDLGGLEAVLVHETGHFDTTALRQVIDQTLVGDIAIDDPRRRRFPWNG